MKKSYETNSRVWKKALNVFLALVLCFSMMPISDTLAKSVGDDASAQTEQVEEKATDDTTNTDADDANKDATDDSNKDATDDDSNKDATDKTNTDSNSTNTDGNTDSSNTNTDSNSGKDIDSIIKDKVVNNKSVGNEITKDLTNKDDDASKKKAEAEAKKIEQDTKKAEAENKATLQAEDPHWTDDVYSAVCKVGTNMYYGTLDDALYDIEKGLVSTDTIEIFRDTQMNTRHVIAQTLTIKNITDPLNDKENPILNGNGHVAQFEVAKDGQLAVGSGGNVTLQGIYANGNGVLRTNIVTGYDSSGKAQTTYGFAFGANSGGTLTIKDGIAGEGTATEIPATTCTITNFRASTDRCTPLRVTRGTLNIQGGLITNNGTNGRYGGAISTSNGTTNISGGEISNNVASYGAGIMIEGNSAVVRFTGGAFKNNTCNWGAVHVWEQTAKFYMSNEASITGNTGYAPAIYVSRGIAYINGGTIENNTSNSSYGAVYYASSTWAPSVQIYSTNSDYPIRIVNNTGGCNVCVPSKSSDVSYYPYEKLTIGNLSANDRIGIGGGYTAVGNQTGVGTVNANVLKYLACISNDQNKTYVLENRSDTKLVWVDTSAKKYTCYSTDASGVTTYYTSLQNAMEALKGQDRTIGIFKDHKFSLSTYVEQSVTSSDMVVKNTENPLNYAVDWKGNSSVNSGKAPTVTFEVKKTETTTTDDTTDPPTTTTTTTYSNDRLIIEEGKKLTIEGVQFDGQSSNRNCSLVRAKNSSTFIQNDGAGGVNAAGTTLQTTTVIKNFRNEVLNGAGAYIYANEGNVTVNINGGKITNMYAKFYNGWNGGRCVLTMWQGGTCTIGGNTEIYGNGYKNMVVTELGALTKQPYACGLIDIDRSTLIIEGNAKIHDNYGGSGAVAFVRHAGAELYVQGNAELYNNVAYCDGGCFFIGSYNESAADVDASYVKAYFQDNAKLYNNFSYSYGGVAVNRDKYTKFWLKDNVQMYNNRVWYNQDGQGRGIGGACIEPQYTYNVGKYYVEGSPYIRNNGSVSHSEDTAGIDSERNLIIYTPSTVTVTGNLDKGCDIGVYGCDKSASDTTGSWKDTFSEGQQFATSEGKNASELSNVAGSFSNDRNRNLACEPGTGTALVWSTNAVVKESTSGGKFVKYWKSLNEAIAGLGSANNVLEILKPHALTGNATATKNVTIKNIVSPVNPTENPFTDTETYTKADGTTETRYVYKEDKDPWVYFTNNTGTNNGTYTLTVNGGVTMTLTGVKFSGQSWNGTAASDVNRANAGIDVIGNMIINNGAEGKMMDSDKVETPNVRTACTTQIVNFHNTTGTIPGGFCRAAGYVTMNGGKITGCYDTSSGAAEVSAKGGGCFQIPTGGTMKFVGGEMSGNGLYSGDKYSNSCIAVGGGKFWMTGGTITNNKGGHGILTMWWDKNGTIDIDGGEISRNMVWHDGGAIFAAGGIVTVTDARIVNNYADRSGGAISYRNATVTIDGSTQIVNNKCRAADGASGAAVVYLGTGYTGTLNVAGSPVITGNGKVGSANLDAAITSTANVYIDKVDRLNVTGTMTKGALIGVTSSTAALNQKGNQFATSLGANASTRDYLTGFYSDVTKENGYALRGSDGGDTKIVWAGLDPTVKVTESVPSPDGTNADGTTKYKYTDVVHTFGGDTALYDAEQCVRNLPAANLVAGRTAGSTEAKNLVNFNGYFPIEILVDSIELTHEAKHRLTIATGIDKPVVLTTAKKATDTGYVADGYPYRGTNAKATLEWVSSGTSSSVLGSNNPLFISSKSDWTLINITLDGNNSDSTQRWLPDFGFIRQYASGSILNLGKGFTLKDCNATKGHTSASYGAIYNASGTINMTDGAVIEDCTAHYGAAIYVSGSSQVNLKDAIIRRCTAITYGGAIYIGGSSYERGINEGLVLDGNTEITGCTAKAGPAVWSNGYSYSSSSSGTTYYDHLYTAATIKGNTKITGNTSTTDYYHEKTGNRHYNGAVTGYNQYYSGDTTLGDDYGMYFHVYLGGNVQITDNTGYDGKACNLNDPSYADDTTHTNRAGKYIVVLEEGLGKGADIGIWSTSNSTVGLTFARTEADVSAKSTGAVNFSRFSNDLEEGYNGSAGIDNRIIWSKNIPVTLVVDIDEAAGEDLWFTFQIQSALTADRSRFAVKIPAGQKSGTVTALIPALMTGYVGLISDGSAYGWSVGSPTYTNTLKAGGTPTETGLGSSVAFACSVTTSATHYQNGLFSTTSGNRELHLKATYTDPDEEHLESDTHGVTNTMNLG